MSKQVVSTKGHLIDSHCTHKDGSLLKSNGLVYDCTLNQTEIRSNNNKFYIMQLIQTKSNYVVYIRYGRIGVGGTIRNQSFGSESQAIFFFEKQFRSKTGNSWGEPFVKKPGKYFFAEIDTVDQSISELESEDGGSADDGSSATVLDTRLIKFLELISNIKYMKAALVELEIDTEKMPLGKIRQSQIDIAYDILNKINQNLDDEDEIERLSSEFYTLVPQVFGMKVPPVINSAKLIGKNLNLLNELSQMVYGTVSVTKLKKTKMNPFLKLYQDLQTEIVALDPADKMFTILKDYAQRSMAPTHTFKFDIVEIFQIDRRGERDLYEKYSTKLKNHTLLFHGTSVANMIGILTNGLVVDPSRLGINVNISGKMFGLGLYFANSCSKSIQYTNYHGSDNYSCLFVSEVALGKILSLNQANSSLTAKTLPKPYNSVWGRGSSSFGEYNLYDDQTQIPSGKLCKMGGAQRSLLHDEFIVYKEEQINLRFIMLLKIK
jgi:poly [ADP-ribose] polymerase